MKSMSRPSPPSTTPSASPTRRALHRWILIGWRGGASARNAAGRSRPSALRYCRSCVGTVIERLVWARGGTRDDLHRALAASLVVSADMAHAVHPNFTARHDPRKGSVRRVWGPARFPATARPLAPAARRACALTVR